MATNKKRRDNSTTMEKIKKLGPEKFFISRLLRRSKQVNREEDGAVHYDQVVDECKKKAPKIMRIVSESLNKILNKM